MRRLAIIAAAVIMLAALIGGGAKADTATPSPTPATVAAYSSRITVRYTYRGIPSIVGVNSPPHLAKANDELKCGRDVLDVVYEAIVDRVGWPWPGFAPCNHIGDHVQICLTPYACSEEFIYTGEDVTVNMPFDFPGATLAIAHFVHEGVPQTVTVTSWLITAGGYVCSAPCSAVGPPLPVQLSEVAHLWPTVSACSPAGEQVDVQFDTIEFGRLHATFEWNGGDVDYDVVIPSAETSSPEVTASPTPTATVTPRRLPSAGGPPASSDVGLPLLAGGLATTALAAGAWRISMRRSRI